MKQWQHACLLATISGLSLPIGAVLGIALSPVRDVVCAAWVAFGAGALLFAVTVELYGHALRELETDKAGIVEMFATIIGAFVGALFYLTVNRALEESCEEPDDEPHGVEDLEHVDGESEGHSTVGTLGPSPTETTPFLPKISGSVGSVLAEERRKWEQSSPKHGRGGREESFCHNPSFRYPSFSQRDASFAFSRYSEGSSTFRVRDRAFGRLAMSIESESLSGSKQGDGRVSVAGSILQHDAELARKGNNVAWALFFGLLVDGVPEGILMGFLAAEGHLSEVLIVSLLMANFPEAFSAASLMTQAGMSTAAIVSMWTGLCLMVGALAGASCYALQVFFPSYPSGDLPQSLLISVAAIQGLTGGAMISCIATVMLPEAFARAGGRMGPIWCSSGFLCTAGFLVAVTLKAIEHHHYNEHPHLELLLHGWK